MIQTQSTGSLTAARKRARAPLIASLLLAFAACGLSPALQAQNVMSAVPEFITLTEQDLRTPVGAEIASKQEAFRTTLGSDPAGALEIAKEIVALTAEAYGETNEYLSQALTNLAIVQMENTNFGASIENFLSAIRARERAAGTIVSADLVNPLRGLAGAYMALDEIERAIPVYERAIHISHVNDGPNNLDQIELIEALSRAHYFLGERDTANDMQDAIFRLRERHFEDSPDQFIDALAQRSVWYSRLGDFEKAVQAYRRLERAISQEYGKDDVRLIEPLVELADVAIQVTEIGEPAINEGRRAIARAVGIAREHGDENPERLARTLVDQGDWLASLNQTRHSRLPYREAWHVLNDDPALHPVRDELFAVPVPIVRAALRPIYGQRMSSSVNPERFPQRGYADITLDIDALGRPTNVRVVNASPPGLMDGHLRRQIRRFRFRPAFRDGQPETYAGFTIRHPFRYDESEFSEEDREVIARTTYEDVEPPPTGAPAAAPVDSDPNLDPAQDGAFVDDTIMLPAAVQDDTAGDASARADASGAEADQPVEGDAGEPTTSDEDRPAAGAPTPGTDST